mgnify:CR=1 FL=1
MFADRLKQLRKEAHLTQKQLADKLFIDQASISNWETNKTKPDFDKQTELAKIFGVSLDYLRGLDDEKEPASVENTTHTDEMPDDQLDKFQFALFGTHEEITDEIMEDVKAYARFKLEQWKKQGKI